MHSEIVTYEEFNSIVKNMKEKLGAEININTQSVTLKPFAYREIMRNSSGHCIEIFRLKDIIEFNQDDKQELSKMNLKCPYCSEDVYLTGFKEKSRVNIHFRHKSSGMDGVEKNKCIYTCRHKDLLRAAYKGVTLEQLYKKRSESFKETQSTVSLPSISKNTNSKVIKSYVTKGGSYKNSDEELVITKTLHIINYLELVKECKNKRKVLLLNSTEDAVNFAKIEYPHLNFNNKTALVFSLELKNDRKIFSIITSGYGVIKSFTNSAQLISWLENYASIDSRGIYYLDLILQIENHNYSNIIDLVEKSQYFNFVNKQSYKKAINDSLELVEILMMNDSLHKTVVLEKYIEEKSPENLSLDSFIFFYDFINTDFTFVSTNLKNFEVGIGANEKIILSLNKDLNMNYFKIDLNFPSFVLSSLYRSFSIIKKYLEGN